MMPFAPLLDRRNHLLCATHTLSTCMHLHTNTCTGVPVQAVWAGRWFVSCGTVRTWCVAWDQGWLAGIDMNESCRTHMYKWVMGPVWWLDIVIRCEFDASLEAQDDSQVLIQMCHVAHTRIHKSCLPYDDWMLWCGANWMRLSRLWMARRYRYVMAPVWMRHVSHWRIRVAHINEWKVSCINMACRASLLIENGSQISVRYCIHMHKLRRTQERVILHTSTSYRVAKTHRMPCLYRLFSAKERWN